jgi:hypothetical protein
MTNAQEVRRHELKFYINRTEYAYACSLLNHLMERDSHQEDADSGYFIRSLYLDDSSDSSVEEKLAGIEQRDKYRLRIYDFDQDWVKLERKRKLNDFVQKTTVVIDRSQALALIDGDFDPLFENANSKLRSILFDLKQRYLEPVVIVDYDRDVYTLDYNEIRITFDKKLRANTTDLDLFSSDIPTRPLQPDEVIIMEVKFNHFLPPWFPQIFQFEGLVRSAISKYTFSRMGKVEYYF